MHGMNFDERRHQGGVGGGPLISVFYSVECEIWEGVSLLALGTAAVSRERPGQRELLTIWFPIYIVVKMRDQRSPRKRCRESLCAIEYCVLGGLNVSQ